MIKKLSRRDILERMAVVSGGAISLSIISACDNGISVPENTDNLNLKVLTKEQFDLVGDIADMIIPETDTPGAKAVNVHFLIDELAANWMLADEKDRFLNDLTVLDERIKRLYGNNFSNLDENGKKAVLDQLGSEMLIAEDHIDSNKHIYQQLRELTIFGYYTSEVGATEELAFDPLPGDYHGCIPFSDVGKTWSV
ncbi:MAG: gluconate 2-dehydrogenase subunit 3 family protein [Alphaproteobacteria bacterium]|nr:gluconate 2-dehydrogenase subunit 3 family protein [Alphaproteobacteria bacterium]HPF47017.1 gluconate 2-dehydrogenase subunit 3 family protein [Emcibacteraceae bacterium]HRW29742.1 gluconate 2-dehydrogenase subunit 3 family protein [Emcibacteraceae bacterium]